MTGTLLVVILAGIIALALVAKKLNVPYPVVFVLGGVAVALIPGVPSIRLEPDLVFLLFLPPLIFGDGWATDYRAFMQYRRPIFALALGLVVVTSVVVAFLTHWMIGIPLAVGFVLGGILSPTDAVATDAVAEDVGLGHAMKTILSGESLVNDASGLVIYRFGVIAVATGAFSLIAALQQFVYAVVVGVAIGIGGGWMIAWIAQKIRRMGLSDALIAVSISLVTPFALYVPADLLGASGVLAAMSGGIFMSRKSLEIFDAESRVAAGHAWELLFFLFNGAAFVLIGLQLREIVRSLPEYSLPLLIGWGLAVTVALVAVRFAWCFLATYGPRVFDRSPGEDEYPPWQGVFVVAFAGMRGIVSLAAALAVPEVVATGARFPERPLILFITFVVILVSLVGEALLLPSLIRLFGDAVRPDTAKATRALARASLKAAEAARAHLRSLEPGFSSTEEWEIAGRIHAGYERRATESAERAEGVVRDGEDASSIERRLRLAALAAERRAIADLRFSGALSDAAFRDLSWSLDLAESRYT